MRCTETHYLLGSLQYQSNLLLFVYHFVVITLLPPPRTQRLSLRGEDIRAVRGFGDSNLEERLGNDVNKRVWQPFFGTKPAIQLYRP